MPVISARLTALDTTGRDDPTPVRVGAGTRRTAFLRRVHRVRRRYGASRRARARSHGSPRPRSSDRKRRYDRDVTETVAPPVDAPPEAVSTDGEAPPPPPASTRLVLARHAVTEQTGPLRSEERRVGK